MEPINLGLSIFYSLSLPREVDAEERMGMLLLAARDLAKDTGIQISRLKSLTPQDCANAQATMNEDFSFARTVCRPPNADRKSPLGLLPEVAHYFRMSGRNESGIDVGIAKYAKGAKFQMLGAKDDDSKPYDGRWYFWNFIDAYNKEESIFLVTLLGKATELGFQTSIIDERNP